MSARLIAIIEDAPVDTIIDTPYGIQTMRVYTTDDAVMYFIYSDFLRPVLEKWFRANGGRGTFVKVGIVLTPPVVKYIKRNLDTDTLDEHDREKLALFYSKTDEYLSNGLLLVYYAIQ